jgi:hypothetical protein
LDGKVPQCLRRLSFISSFAGDYLFEQCRGSLRLFNQRLVTTLTRQAQTFGGDSEKFFGRLDPLARIARCLINDSRQRLSLPA